MDRAELLARKALLRQLLAKRENMAGYAVNVQALKDELARIEKQLG